MKKLFTISLLFLLLQTNSQAQTQFPFYGFELSNYEVGDTLEYSYESTSGTNGYSFCRNHELYLIINKEFLGASDSIRFSYRKIVNGGCMSGQESHDNFSNGTFQIIINNDTVYGNNNNLLGIPLYRFDSSNTYDSSYLKYDTIGGLKRVKLYYENFGSYYKGYEAIENLGVVFTHQATENFADIDWSHSLEFAHLAHYGIYGSYYEISDNVNEPIHSKEKISIQYESDGNIFLSLSSSENLKQPLLSVYDLLGRKIKTIPVTVRYNQIEISNLPKGMYLYKVESEEKILGQGKLMSF